MATEKSENQRYWSVGEAQVGSEPAKLDQYETNSKLSVDVSPPKNVWN